MKVLIGWFMTESNAHVHHLADASTFRILTGEDCLNAMDVRGVFESNGIEVIPSLYASAGSNGVVEQTVFQYICNEMIRIIRARADEIDGIFLFLHGASAVQNLPGTSGDHYLLHIIRQEVGKYMPIAVAMDPHGNVTKEFCEEANIIRCYRESPHIDAAETRQIVARKLIDLLCNRRNIHPVIRELPMMLGGERCESAEEPLKSINQRLDEAEKDSRIFSTSYHIGYLRHDDDKIGAAVVVVPTHEEFTEYCQKVADEIGEYAWSRRHDFGFKMHVAEPDQALAEAISSDIAPIVITDSGDNCGAGAGGYNTIMLRQTMKLNEFNSKKILIAGIVDPTCTKELAKQKVGDHVSCSVGIHDDELSAPVMISGVIKRIGEQRRVHHLPENIGPAVTIAIENRPIDVMIWALSYSACEFEQYEAAELNLSDYDIVIEKQGYLEPDMKKFSAYHIMALTDGPTYQMPEKWSYKKIRRPMYPIDKI